MEEVSTSEEVPINEDRDRSEMEMEMKVFDDLISDMVDEGIRMDRSWDSKPDLVVRLKANGFRLHHIEAKSGQYNCARVRFFQSHCGEKMSDKTYPYRTMGIHAEGSLAIINMGGLWKFVLVDTFKLAGQFNSNFLDGRNKLSGIVEYDD